MRLLDRFLEVLEIVLSYAPGCPCINKSLLKLRDNVFAPRMIAAIRHNSGHLEELNDVLRVFYRAIKNDELILLCPHDGPFHLDDIAATALLEILADLLGLKYQVRRGYELDDMANGLMYDVGAGFLDHHQANARIHKDTGHKYAAVGLVFSYIGSFLCSEKRAKCFDELLRPIEDVDNGLKDVNSAITRAFKAFNPRLNNRDDWRSIDKCFEEAVSASKVLLGKFLSVKEIGLDQSFIDDCFCLAIEDIAKKYGLDLPKMEKRNGEKIELRCERYFGSLLSQSFELTDSMGACEKSIATRIFKGLCAKDRAMAFFISSFKDDKEKIVRVLVLLLERVLENGNSSAKMSKDLQLRINAIMSTIEGGHLCTGNWMNPYQVNLDDPALFALQCKSAMQGVLVLGAPVPWRRCILPDGIEYVLTLNPRAGGSWQVASALIDAFNNDFWRKVPGAFYGNQRMMVFMDYAGAMQAITWIRQHSSKCA